MTRQPAASCPAGFVDGLPIGLQVVGPMYREDLVLRAAAAFEAARPFRMARG
jgi:aspartyl-tRNA(Asn)/glutamyl-tRNA(Gln) amidotransferase subunit A